MGDAFQWPCMAALGSVVVGRLGGKMGAFGGELGKRMWGVAREQGVQPQKSLFFFVFASWSLGRAGRVEYSAMGVHETGTGDGRRRREPKE